VHAECGSLEKIIRAPAIGPARWESRTEARDFVSPLEKQTSI